MGLLTTSGLVRGSLTQYLGNDFFSRFYLHDYVVRQEGDTVVLQRQEIFSAAGVLDREMMVLEGSGLTVVGGQLIGGTVESITMFNGRGGFEWGRITDISIAAGTFTAQFEAAMAGSASGFTQLLQSQITQYAGSASDDTFRVFEAYAVRSVDMGGGNDRLALYGELIRPEMILVGGEGFDHLDIGGSRAVRVDLEANSLAVSGAISHVAVGFERVTGSSANDTLITNSVTSGSLSGGSGNDLLRGGAGEDTLNGGRGADRLIGAGGSDTLNGNDGNDRLFGGNGADLMRGGDGNDRLDGGLRNDSLSGEEGNDYLLGGDGDDRIDGGDGNDRIEGGAGLDVLSGGAGFDRVFGNAGADQIQIGEGAAIGGSGPDTLYGGDGAVMFGDDVTGGALRADAALVYRIYTLTLGRPPSRDELDGWMTNGALPADNAGRIIRDITRSDAFSEHQSDLGPLWLGSVFKALPGFTAREDVLQSIDHVGSFGYAEALFRTLIARDDVTAILARDAAIYALEMTPQAWADDIYRLFQATLGREPNAPGMETWLGEIDSGRSLLSIVDGFTGSREFRDTYGALDDRGFVELLFLNVLGRPGAEAGLDFWTQRLADGASRSEIVLGFSQSREFRNGTAEDVERWMRAQGEDDVLIAGTGRQDMVGGAGSDRFVFTPEGGAQGGTVHDLEAWDTLDLTAFGFANAAAALDHFSARPGFVAFEAQGISVNLFGLELAQIDADMLLV